jgi:3-methylcrotonyl-CoA carboxylase alpha subunit
MIAKIVAWGPTRPEAIARLHRALSETVVELVGPAGPAATNLEFLKKLLESEEVKSGDYDTSFAEKLAKQLKSQA